MPSTTPVGIAADKVNGLPPVPSVPTDVPADGMILYVSNQAQGGTGLYFLNAESTKDEIISNNRSLVYSMIF